MTMLGDCRGAQRRGSVWYSCELEPCVYSVSLLVCRESSLLLIDWCW